MENIRLFRFMERMHFTYEEAMAQPAELVDRAFIIWELDAKHAKLKVGN